MDNYIKRKDVYYDLLQKQIKKIDRVANIRLIVALTGIGNIIFLYLIKEYYYIYYIFIAYMSVFIFLVIKHNKLKYNKKYFNRLHKINEDALLRLRGNWNEFGDTGVEFQDDNHGFSSDLDIFGKGSLFQYINTTTTHMGREILRKYLTQPCKDKEIIRSRQQAIEELSYKLPWRQRLMAEGLMTTDKSTHKGELYDFFETENEAYTKYWLIIGARLLPITNIGIFLLSIFKKIPYKISIIMLAIQIILLIFKSSERSKNLDLVYRYVDSIKVYGKMIGHIEKGNFKSEYLLKLKDRLVDIDKLTACEQIKELENIGDSISNRNNSYFMVINIIRLWDYQCMIRLEQWKKKSGLLIRTWFETVGDFEALSSLANIGYDNPDWVIPEITDNPYYIMAKDMGHPLLTDKRVCNDFKIDGSTRVLLITGSNMSGKSTYLRTIGINLVLAYAGAPVCAKEFSCNIFNIYTCMRVSDNLEQNISSFYAELLRIKKVIGESKTNKVFFLLDEVFKGTNSYDRHEGAKILINRLLNNKAIGLVSTHDLELGVLEKESKGEIRNYHFKEYYKNNKIYFDYKINRGISTTRNAMYLIKMMGIDD